MRYAKALTCIGLFYMLPLVAHPTALLDIRMIVLMVTCVVILLSQPEMTVSDTREQRRTDGFSVVVILVAAAMMQIGAVLEWTYMRELPALDLSWTVPALALITCGAAIRIWAIRTLGRSFTATVQCHEGQEVVTSGPFRWVRHPSYLGAYMSFLGSAMLLQAPIALFGGAILLAAAYAYRIRLEERTLVAELAGYAEYRHRTARLIPVLW